MNKPRYIVRSVALAVFLLMLLALAPAKAQIVVYQGETTPLEVVEKPGDDYTWELYSDSTVNFAQVPGACPASNADFDGGNHGSAVKVAWKEPGIYFFKVTARNASGCTNNLKIGRVKVLPSLPKAVISIDPGEKCNDGSPADLSVVFSGGKGPWKMKMKIKDLVNGTTTIKDYTINAANNPYSIPVNPINSTEYTIIELSNFYGSQPDLTDPSYSAKLQIHPLPLQSPIYLKKP